MTRTEDNRRRSKSTLIARLQTDLLAGGRLLARPVARRAAAPLPCGAKSSGFSRVHRFLTPVVRSGCIPFVLPAFGTLALLTYVEPGTARTGFHLAERLIAVLACGAWLMAVLASRSGATQEPSSVPDPNEVRARSGWPPPAASPVDHSARAKTATISQSGVPETAEEANWLWRRGLLLVALWLVAALGHLTAHYFLNAADRGASVSIEAFFRGVGQSLEQQLLGLQVALLVLVLVCVALEDAFRAGARPPVRVYMVALAFGAVLASSLSELDAPLTAAGWLIGIHVLAMTAWCGGAAAALALAWHTDDFVLLHDALSRFSELAAVTAVTVLVTGGAMGLDWTGQHTSANLIRTIDGVALLAKTFLGVALLLGAGYVQRSRSLPRLLAKKPSARTFCTVGALELTGMSVATAFGVLL